MSCIPSALIFPVLGCKPSVGGIKKIQIGYGPIMSFTATIDDESYTFVRNHKIDVPGAAHAYAWDDDSETYTVFTKLPIIESTATDKFWFTANDTGTGNTITSATTGEFDPNDTGTWTYTFFDSMPEKSTYNTTYSYDKQTNVGLWTTTVTLDFGEYTPAIKSALAALHYKEGRPVKLTTENGMIVTVVNAKWTGAEIAPGTQMTDGQTGTITLTAIHKDPVNIEVVA